MGNIHHQGLKLTLATHSSGAYGAALPCLSVLCFMCILRSATSGLLTKLDEVEAAGHHF